MTDHGLDLDAPLSLPEGAYISDSGFLMVPTTEPTQRTCALCGRVGVSQFLVNADTGESMCSNVRACERRSRVDRNRRARNARGVRYRRQPGREVTMLDMPDSTGLRSQLDGPIETLRQLRYGFERVDHLLVADREQLHIDLVTRADRLTLQVYRFDLDHGMKPAGKSLATFAARSAPAEVLPSMIGDLYPQLYNECRVDPPRAPYSVGVPPEQINRGRDMRARFSDVLTVRQRLHDANRFAPLLERRCIAYVATLDFAEIYRQRVAEAEQVIADRVLSLDPSRAVHARRRIEWADGMWVEIGKGRPTFSLTTFRHRYPDEYALAVALMVNRGNEIHLRVDLQ